MKEVEAVGGAEMWPCIRDGRDESRFSIDSAPERAKRALTIPDMLSRDVPFNGRLILLGGSGLGSKDEEDARPSGILELLRD